MRLKESFEILRLSQQEIWNKYLYQIPDENRDVYFSPEYYKLYEELGDGVAECFVFRRKNYIILYPYLLNSINDIGYKLPNTFFDIQGAYGYNGAVTNSSDHDFYGRFRLVFEDYCTKKNIIAEFTRFHPLINNHRIFQKNMQIIPDRKTVCVDLRKSYEKIWLEDYSSQNRNMIRKAQKNDFSCKILSDPGLDKIQNFIDTYNSTMDKLQVNKYYYFKPSYFKDIFLTLKPYSFLILVLNRDNELVSSAIFFIYGKFAHYHLSGRDEKADNSTNNFMLDQAVLIAKQKGADFFHFGGGTSSDINDPLLKFKKNFSKTTLDFLIGKQIHNQKIYTEVERQWRINYPGKINLFKHVLLKYRY